MPSVVSVDRQFVIRHETGNYQAYYIAEAAAIARDSTPRAISLDRPRAAHQNSEPARRDDTGNSKSKSQTKAEPSRSPATRQIAGRHSDRATSRYSFF